MGYEDQEIRLGLRTDVPERAADARKAMAGLKQETVELGDVYEVLTTDLSQADKAMDKMVAEAVEATRAQRLMREALNDTAHASTSLDTATMGLETSARRATSGMTGFGQSAMQAGRFMQDFQAAGIMGVANNLEGLSMALGGGAGLAGVLTLAAVAYLAFKPQLEDLGKQLGLIGEEAAPSAASGLDQMEAALKRVKERVEEANKSRLDSVADLERYNELVRSELALEEKITKEKQEQERIKKFLEMKPEDEEKAAKEAAKVLRSRIGGRPEQQQLIDMVMAESPSAKRDAAATRVANIEAYMKQVEEEGASGGSTMSETQARLDDLEKMRAEALAELNAEEARRQKEAQERVRKAVEEGDAREIDRLREVTAARAAKGDARAMPIDRELYRATPKGRQEMRDVNAEVDEAVASQIEEAKEEAKAAKKAADDAAKAEKERQARVWRYSDEELDAEIKEEKRAAAEKKKADDEAKRKAAERQREAERASREAARTVTPEQLLEQQMAQAIRQEAPGLTEGEAAGAARRAAELQRQGFDLNSAMVEAVQETQAILGGNVALLQALRDQVEAVIQQNREIRGSFLRRGGR